MNAQDIYINSTTSKGKSTITRHRVWDVQRFLNSMQAQARVASEKEPKEAYQVTIATEADYLKSKAPR